MNYLEWFAFPYRHLLAPWIHHSIPFIIGLSLVAIALDLFLPSRTDRQKGRLTLVLMSVNLLLIQNQLLPAGHIAHIPMVIAAAVILVVYGLLFRRTLRDEWLVFRRIPPFKTGLLVILVITAVKLIELETWPPFLNEYAGNTGVIGLSAVEGKWPENVLQGRGFDLRGGGESPLMLPVMWLAMRQFGINVWSVRFSEVIGSTVLLLVLWVWLRRTLPDAWSLAALAVFGLSPWHLAQSRMGTFFSISTAIAVGMLMSAERLARARQFSTAAGWWVLFGLFAGCIGWCYAPMKVLYLFFLYVILILPFLIRKKQQKTWAGALCALLAFGVLFTSQFQGLQHPKQMFQSHFGGLATDNPVWRKTVDDRVVDDVQPLAIVAKNIHRNGVEWVRVTFSENDILRFYSGAWILSIAVVGLCFILRWSSVFPIYYLCALLPPLLIFPLHRRTLILWPFVYVAAVIVFREIAVSGAALARQSKRRSIIPVTTGICLALTMFHGFHIWISTWSVVKDHSYFGPARRLEAMHFADNIMDSHSIVFVNPWVHADVIRITLHNANREHDGKAWQFAHVTEQSTHLQRYRDRFRPTAFIFFDLNHQTWLPDMLRRSMPGGVLQDFRNPDNRRELLYSVYTVYP